MRVRAPSWIRDVKRRAIRFRPDGRPPITIFGIRRGGSTLLADMVAAQPGVWFADEPFAVFSPTRPFVDRMRARLPERPHGQLFDLDAREQEQVARYLEDLLAARFPIGTARRTRGLLRADRVALKILNAPALVDWITRTFATRSVLLTRHPAAQAASVLRLGWGFSAEAYFARGDFLAERFGPEPVAFGQGILARGTDWQRAVLNWVVESWMPLRFADPAVPRLAYEELVLAPERCIPPLWGWLELDCVERALDRIARPSGSSRLTEDDTRAAIRASDREALVGRWQSRVDADARRAAQEILDAFGVDVYDLDAPTPRRPLDARAPGAAAHAGGAAARTV